MAEAVALFGVSSSTHSLPSLSLPSKSIHRSHTPIVCFLRSHSVGFGYLTHSNRRHVYAAVVSSDSKATTSIDLSQPDLDNTGGDTGAGNGKGFGGGGGGGGEGGGDNSKDEEGSDEDKRKMALSMSQKLTLGYAVLVGAGGVMGYLKSGSQKSLLAGGLSAALLYYVYTELPVRPVLASSLGLGISAALLGVMGSRFKKSGKVFPAGVVSLVSLIMTGGYLHGIMRSAH
ncbi:protein FATTY ACID EXPORT 2, chloroplastic-like [Gastrolobium bilobum]|uniref:protein FATTY ACID EXPORT 2, chloroplastic-like n=1 Tax=Gastrolobium bilobum TaxID=150636 RepID=UPI002AAFDA6A|nr:protein FATTY ACID EXPORT 2, chloroplastic-like [Gastrolobium bilobum]